MQKIIATVAASVVLTIGLAVPSYAEEPAPAVPCEQTVQEYQHREVLLGYQIDALQETTQTMNRDLVRAERRIERQRATIERLRAKLAARR